MPLKDCLRAQLGCSQPYSQSISHKSCQKYHFQQKLPGMIDSHVDRNQIYDPEAIEVHSTK